MIMKYSTIFLLFIFSFDAIKIYFGLSNPVTQFLLLIPLLIAAILENLKYFSIILKNKTFKIHIWLVVYSLTNLFFINEIIDYRNQSKFIFIFSIIIPVLVTFLALNPKLTFYKLVTIIKYSLALRLVLVLIFDSFGFGGNSNISRFGYRLNSNSVAIGAFFLIVSIVILLFLKRDKLKLFDKFLIMTSVIVIFLTSSKKVFIVLFLFSLISYIIFNLNKKKNFAFIKILIIIAFSFFAFNYTINNTNVGKRLQGSFEKSLTADSNEQLFDNRGRQYIDGIRVFNDSPYFGVGLKNYTSFSEYNTPLHSEILVQLVENGLIGFSLFLIFIFSNLKTIYKLNTTKSIRYLLYLLLLLTFSLLFGTWLYNNLKIWIPFILIMKSPQIRLN